LVYEQVLTVLALLSMLGITNDVQHAQLTQILAQEEAVLASSTSSTKVATPNTVSDIFEVPYYSQFADISSPTWKKVGCGIASLAMLIEFYEPGTVHVDTLLQQGISAGAYLSNAGWTYAGLIGVSHAYGLSGASHDLAGSTLDSAFTTFTNALTKGPVMASVHYTFEPTNPIPHLVIVTGIKGDKLYYNDPARGGAGDSISVTQFKKAWKKRYVEFWPVG
jgi:uncharacterized protein YvpB